METFTNKMKQAIIFQNNKFTLSYDGKTKTTWRCTIKGCVARIHTDKDGSVLQSSGSVTHNHADKVKNVIETMLRTQCKRKADDSIGHQPAKILRRELATLSDTTTLKDVSITSCKKAMYRCPRKFYPVLPKNANDTVQKLKDIFCSTSRKEDFLMTTEMIDDNNALVIFTCTSNLGHLASADTILADGTFYITPKYFYQLYTVHAYLHGKYVPLVFGLLPNKTEHTYLLFLTKIMEQCRLKNLIFNPKIILLDFEIAAINAFRSEFQHADIMLCRFHYGQALYRKICALGLKNEYSNTESDIGQWLKLFFALPF